eukprot:gnl/Chilomastix_cuspidata/511.p2 GENE.gnl/Chilomastix_cuspidata/511~~gnl/Chilomastix_cuspidata/511.p2  ORF type:complete len:105 (+),score=35.34 gnl/Chilomastix_cuspidata/511:37-315(+)
MSRVLKLGEEASIEFNYSAGTGYLWYFTKPLGLDIVSDVISSGGGHVSGGPVNRKITFKAVLKGPQVVDCVFARSWQIGEPRDTQKHTFVVE